MANEIIIWLLIFFIIYFLKIRSFKNFIHYEKDMS